MPKTIADLVTTESTKPAVIGKSMLCEDPKQELNRLQLKLKALEESRRKENELLESGGYDYDGREEFIQVMERLGRR